MIALLKIQGFFLYLRKNKVRFDLISQTVGSQSESYSSRKKLTLTWSSLRGRNIMSGGAYPRARCFLLELSSNNANCGLNLFCPESSFVEFQKMIVIGFGGRSSQV